MKPTHYLAILLLLAVYSCAPDRFADVRVFYNDGRTDSLTVLLERQSKALHLQIPTDQLSGVDSVLITPDFAKANAGDPGYFVFPNGMLCKFPESEDRSYSLFWQQMPISGSFTPSGNFMAIVKGLRMENTLINKVKDGHYALSYRFDFTNVEPYEDIIIDWYELKGDAANYSGMGRLYRKYQLDRGEVQSYKERAKNNPLLAYAAASPEIRVRTAWKPAPATVRHQTLENEPPVHPAVTFDRVCDIIDSLKARGVDKAELCLVGWQKSGHDGRYPDVAPVEPLLGGEDALKKLIAYADQNGYKIAAHTNSSDAYQIANSWDDDLIVQNADGSLHYSETWSGGDMYKLCLAHVENIIPPAQHDYVKSLGFNGMHYIDCHSNNYPQPCYNPAHPFNRKEQAEAACRHLEDARTKFGGVQCEGAFDFVASAQDYIIYVTFDLDKSKHNPMVDRYVPLWNIVYNGIILNNAATETVNYTIKDPVSELKAIEFGSRPLFYFYSAFRSDAYNWMGNADLRCATEDELSTAVSAISKGYEDMKKLGYLQYEFLDENRELAPEVFLSRWSDGSEVICNYSSEPYTYKGREVQSLSYELYKSK